MSTGRPATRTAVVNPDSLELFKQVFGSSGHAYRQIGRGMSYSVFRRAWDGKEVTPQVVRSLEGSWKDWSERLVARLSAA